jgi:hypothetical protein
MCFFCLWLATCFFTRSFTLHESSFVALGVALVLGLPYCANAGEVISIAAIMSPGTVNFICISITFPHINRLSDRALPEHKFIKSNRAPLGENIHASNIDALQQAQNVSRGPVVPALFERSTVPIREYGERMRLQRNNSLKAN